MSQPLCIESTDRVCPAPGGCESCPDPGLCCWLRLNSDVTIEAEEAAAAGSGARLMSIEGSRWLVLVGANPEVGGKVIGDYTTRAAAERQAAYWGAAAWVMRSPFYPPTPFGLGLDRGDYPEAPPLGQEGK